jgi:hypothetical protein
VKFRALCVDQRILLSDAAAQLIDLVRERAKTGELILEKGVIFALCKEQARGAAQLLTKVVNVLLETDTAKALKGRRSLLELELKSRICIAKSVKLSHEAMQVGDADVRQGIAGQSFCTLGGVVRGLARPGVHGLSSCHVEVTQTTAR